MRTLSLEQIKEQIDIQHIIQTQEEGFKGYSQGKVNTPPVGYLAIPEAPGDYHIKYGMFYGDDVFVVKLAGGFYQNPTRYGIPSMQGIILIFSAKTGQPLVLLQDEGYLTNLRTAVAGFLAAKYLAPKEISAIGVLGTGIQARMQVNLLKEQTLCRDLWVWGRNAKNLEAYSNDMKAEGFHVFKADSPQEVAEHCNLIITTTPSSTYILNAQDIHPGTHITAVGADAPNKQELDPVIFEKAHLCVVDSKSQCLDHGDISHAVNRGIISETKIVELGQIIADSELGRTFASPDQITVADLTGVAFQDILIAKSVGRKFLA